MTTETLHFQSTAGWELKKLIEICKWRHLNVRVKMKTDNETVLRHFVWYWNGPTLFDYLKSFVTEFSSGFSGYRLPIPCETD